MNQNLYSLFESRFPADRSRPLLILEDGSEVSYAVAEEGASRYARLLAGLGLAPGDRVAVQVEKSPDALLLYLGCLKAGLAYLPLNSAYQEGEVFYFLENAQPRAVIAQPSSMPWLAPLAGRLGIRHVFSLDAQGHGTLDDAAHGLPPWFQTVERAGDDLAAILYTSGTTGRSKGAMLTTQPRVERARCCTRTGASRPGDVLIHALPIFHVHGLFVACHCVLLERHGDDLPSAASTRVAPSRTSPSATVFMGVPTFYVRLLADPGLTPEACAHMRLFVSGSAPLLAETHAEFSRRTGHRILERYGMTETGMLTSNPLDGERRPGTVGSPLPGAEVRIVDDADKPVAPGEVGTRAGQGRQRVLRATGACPRRRRRSSRRRLVPHRRHRQASRSTATSPSSGAARTSSSAAATTSIRRRSRSRSTSCPACASRPWSACRIPISARR